MINFIKGIATGLGAVAPGLSGSILLVIFGLYQKTIGAISGLFKNFKKNFLFLLPLGCGILLGVVLFSKLVDWLLAAFEMQTRYAFLGLILGSIPLFFKETGKEGFSAKYYIHIFVAASVGAFIFIINNASFPKIQDPSFLQSMLLGLVVAISYVVPGIDSASILSALGMYELWVATLADFNFAVLIPAGIGALVGVLVVSFIINKLIAKCYTATFSVIFGLFLSVVPSVVLTEVCIPKLDIRTAVSVLLLVVCFVLSLLFSNLDKIKSKS